MTRINILPPKYLADQHLIAEIKEINQLAGQLNKSLHSKNFRNFNIPEVFTLNKGHVKFFYNKGKYLHLRFLALQKEAQTRGFAIKSTFYDVWEENPVISSWYDEWKPSEEAYNIITNRILDRVLISPKSKTRKENWYRFNGKPITNEQYSAHILNFFKENETFNFSRNISPDPLLR